MGYCVTYRIENFIIPLDKVPSLIEVLFDNIEDEDSDLDEWFYEWGWDTRMTKKGLEVVSYSREKIDWEEEKFFQTVAPFVNPNAIAHGIGEDGGHWRWIFKDGKAIHQEGKIAFD